MINECNEKISEEQKQEEKEGGGGKIVTHLHDTNVEQKLVIVWVEKPFGGHIAGRNKMQM